MKEVLKLLADIFHVNDAIIHWRLSILLAIGSVIACSLWVLARSHVTGSILFLAVEAVAASVGIIWERGRL